MTAGSGGFRTWFTAVPARAWRRLSRLEQLAVLGAIVVLMFVGSAFVIAYFGRYQDSAECQAWKSHIAEKTESARETFEGLGAGSTEAAGAARLSAEMFDSRPDGCRGEP